ncbi:MAG: DeoR family transcriptional regulator, partial [Thermoplasmata archaeon]
MNQEELNLILDEGEGYKIEFKEQLSNIDKEFVAFANSSGGRIFLGVSDDKKIKGITITNKLKSQIQDIANNCEPPVQIFLEQFKNILIITVREGEDKPYKCSSGFYKRIGPNTKKLTRNEILELFKSEGKVRFDELIEPKFQYPHDFDINKFNRFLELGGISKISDIEAMLVNLGVAEKQEGRLYFNNAGILFFAKDPQKFIPWSVFTVALFKDEYGTDIIDRKEITGGLFEIVEEVMKFVKLYSKVAYRFTGMPQRENIYEYPFEALREAVINSVMHKYYFEHGHNNILRFLPNCIKIENYWEKPAHFVLGKTVFRRNHIIADLFARIHFGEKMGTGFERIKKICEKENAPFPEIEFNDNYFYVTFKQSREYLKLTSGEEKYVPGHVPENVPEKRREDMLLMMKKNNQVTIAELARYFGVTEKTIKRDIEKLKKEGKLNRIGPDKGGYWDVTA